MARLSPLPAKRTRTPGGAEGLKVPDSFFEPLPDDIHKAVCPSGAPSTGGVAEPNDLVRKAVEAHRQRPTGFWGLRVVSQTVP